MTIELEYTDDESAKFWRIEVDENIHIVCFGKIGTNGQTKTKEFATNEDAIKMAERLVKAKQKKGYKTVEEEIDTEAKWFERLKHKIFTIYKASILKYPVKKYKYIQFNWTGQGFALGMSTNPRDGDHVYIDGGDWHNEDETSIEDVYRVLEDIPYEEYDEEDDCEYEVEFEREEWPQDRNDCFELESFLINVGLGLTYIKLEKDKEVKKYLEEMEVIIIESSDREFGNFTRHHPEEKIKTKVVETLLNDKKEQQLILDLWGKKAKGTGIEFLNHFTREVTKIKDMPKLSLKEARAQAHDLTIRFRSGEAVEVLKPVLENALHNSEVEDPALLEKCCDVMGKSTVNVKDGCKESISWFQKGLEFVPNGHCAISLMSLYELDVRDDKAMVAFCEQHIQNINLDDNVDHTVSAYRYLGKGYLALGNKEKAKAIYEKIIEFAIRMDEKWRIDYAVDDLEDYSDWESEYKIANEILAELSLGD